MIPYNGKLIVFCFFIAFLLLAGGPDRGKGAALVDPDSEDTVVFEKNGGVYVVDRRNRLKLPIPAPYWRYETPEQVRRESGKAAGGCAPGGGIPEGLLFVLSNKDSPASGMSLEKMPNRFLLRDGEDLKRYIRKQEGALLEQMEDAGELIRSDAENRNGMVVYEAVYDFTVPGSENEMKVVMANFMIRPPGEKLLVYQLQGVALAEWYPSLQEDFEAVIDGFTYTGERAESFFVADAPAEDLPFAIESGEQPSPVQYGEGIVGIIIAAVGVMVVYKLIKRNDSASPSLQDRF